jgi:predicted RNA-binding Zn ribbon-like protein
MSIMAVILWSWLGDRLALDFVNTVRRRGTSYIELLASPADLAVWLDRERERITVPEPVDDDLLARFITARDHALVILRCRAAGRALPVESLEAINSLVLAAPVVRLLGPEPGSSTSRAVTAVDGTQRLLGDLAAAVIECAEESDALTLCDSPGCGQLYFRARPNQQWCNPRCGNRARTQRYADRTRSSGRSR